MKDLTLLYYTANTIEDVVPNGPVADNIRRDLLDVTGNQIPIISVSQKPIDFGENICVGTVGRSLYNCYKQIFLGAKKVKTKYIACCEDDALYNTEHFTHRPSSDGVFSFNSNMRYAEDKYYWNKESLDYGMFGCICSTELLIKTLAPRFELFPKEPMPSTNRNQEFWQEPGRFDRKFGVHHVKTETFKTKEPILVLNYTKSMCGKRGVVGHTQTIVESIEPHGKAKDLWLKLWL